LNKDGTVNIVDMATVAKAFGSRPIIPEWNAVADMNVNEVINIVDVAKAAESFGKQTDPQ